MCYGINCQEKEIDIEHMREGGRERSCRKNSFKPLAAKLIFLPKIFGCAQTELDRNVADGTHKQTPTQTHTYVHKLKPYTACTHLQLLPHVPQFHSLFALHFCHIAALAPFFTLLLH